MAINIPYPTMSGSFVPTGASTIDEYVPDTVHNDDAHNNPHAKLLANDVDLDSRLQAVETAVVGFTRITPAEIYVINHSYRGSSPYFPSEFIKTSDNNYANNGTYQTHSYSAGLSSSASSVIMRVTILCAGASGGGSSSYCKLRSVSPSTLFPEATVAWGSAANSDDWVVDTVHVEMPYQSTRTFQSYCYGHNYFAVFIFAVGYRL